MIRRCPTLLTLLAAISALGMGLQAASSRADGLAYYTLTSNSGLSAPPGPPPGTPSVTLNNIALSSGSTNVSVPSTTGVAVGYQVSGTGIPTGTTVTAIGSNGMVTLSQNATVSAPETLTFTPTIAPPQVVALIEPAGGVVTPASSSPLGPLTILSGSQGFNTSGVYDYLANTTQNGQPLQALGLSFYGQGLASLANGGILKFSLDVANPSSPPQLVYQTPTSGTPSVSITLQPSGTESGGGASGSGGTSGGGGSVSAAETPEPLSVLIWSALTGAGVLRTRALRKSRRANRS